MSEQQKSIDLGIFSRRSEGFQISSTEIVAGVLSVVWLLGISMFFMFSSGEASDSPPRVDNLRFVITIIALFMPVALIWVTASMARSMRLMREESARLQTAINAMRHSYIQQQQSGVLGVKSSVENKLEEIAAAQRKTDAALSMFTSVRPETEQLANLDKAALASAQQAPVQSQPSLALGTPAEALTPPLSVSDFIRAMNFPETADDKAGFRALRKALQDRHVSQLIQAAQDVLTLLSQDGIYMDDLEPDRARPEIWRKFAGGERGKPVAALGGIRDRSSLALASGRMRQDTIFRDSVHHFLRKFDQIFSQFEKSASDQQIVELAGTRSARAFMLLGRVTGTFD